MADIHEQNSTKSCFKDFSKIPKEQGPLVLLSNGFELGLLKENSITDKLLKDLVRRSDYVWPKTGGFELFFKNLPGNIFWQTNSIQKKEEKVIRKTIQGLVHTQSHSDQKYRYLACVGDSRVYMFTTQNGPFLKTSQITQKLNAAKGNAL